VAGDPWGEATASFMADKQPKSRRNWANFRPKVAESLATEKAKIGAFRWVFGPTWGRLRRLRQWVRRPNAFRASILPINSNGSD